MELVKWGVYPKWEKEKQRGYDLTRQQFSPLTFLLPNKPQKVSHK